MHPISHNIFKKRKPWARSPTALEAMVSILDFILNDTGNHLKGTLIHRLNAAERVNNGCLGQRPPDQ